MPEITVSLPDHSYQIGILEGNISQLLVLMHPRFESVDSFGNTSVHDAIQNSQSYLVKVLIEHGVNPNVQNNRNEKTHFDSYYENHNAHAGSDRICLA